MIKKVGELANETKGLKDNEKLKWDVLSRILIVFLEASKEASCNADNEALNELEGQMSSVTEIKYNITKNSGGVIMDAPDDALEGAAKDRLAQLQKMFSETLKMHCCSINNHRALIGKKMRRDCIELNF